MLNEFQTLYKIDNKNKIREWKVSVEDFGSYAIINVVHGEENGKKQTKQTIIKSGKNIGKANETTCLEQAIFEAKSKWSKQIDKGYCEEPNNNYFRPMLAHNFKDHYKKVKYHCYVQPKLDGLRCYISWEHGKPVARSRKGKIWKTLDNILDPITSYLKNNPHIVLDGEIFSREISFQDICSAVKRDEPNDLTSLAQFWCYDLFNSLEVEMPFSDRVKCIPEIGGSFVNVQTELVLNKNEIDNWHSKFLAESYEGTMIRNLNGLYKVDGRSYDLLKYKDFQDAEYKIVGKELDKNNETVFICLDEKTNKEFKCKPEGTHEQRVKYYEEDNIGKYLSVRFFELTEDGLPRFPVGTTVRID